MFGWGEGGTYATADEDTADDLRPWVDAWLGSPSEPEETDDQDDSADYHGRKTLFGDDFLRFREFRCEDHLGFPSQSAARNEHSNKDGNERQ
jgi:hypothetical protein